MSTVVETVKFSDENKDGTTSTSVSEDIKALAEEAGIGIVEAKTDDGEGEDAKEDEKKDDGNKEADKKKYADWPFRNIKEPHENDVLYGRGGGTNHHAGNKRYRKIVEDRKVDYVNCKRLDKPLVALSIIRDWRGQSPPGRFLKMDEKTGLWNDVGDKKAREKTSQALRERAPQIRQELEKERIARERKERGESTEEEDDDEDEAVNKSTRFAEGTNLEGSKRPGVVARDHSLGREYLDPDEKMTLEGFSWQEPVRGNSDMERVGSQSSYSAPPMPYGIPGARMGSHGSFGPPMPPGPYEHMTGDVRYASWGRDYSWSSMSGGPPPQSMGYGYPTHSGSWPEHSLGVIPTSRAPASREHSLGGIPLSHATVNQAAYPTAFDHGRNESGHWGPLHPPYSPMEGPMIYHMSGGPPGPFHGAQPRREYSGPPPRREYSGSVPLVAPSSPSYSLHPAVASQWSGRDPEEIAKTMSRGSSGDEQDSFNSTPTGLRKTVVPAPKPDLVKRTSSNQNETVETKPDFDGQSVKRAALNRDSSTAANRLKAKYMPGYFDTKKELELLSTNLEQSTLDSDVPKPAQYLKEDRMTTLDINALDLVVKPLTLRSTSRSTTLDALMLDFDDDPLIGPSQFDRSNLSSMEDLFDETKDDDLPRPPALSAAQRLTTSDMFDIVNEPLADE